MLSGEVTFETPRKHAGCVRSTKLRLRFKSMQLIFRKGAEYLRTAAYLLRGGATFSSILSYPLHRRRHGINQLRLKNGVTLTAPSTEPLLPIFEEVWVHCRYEQPTCVALADDVIVDIGAHVGVFTVWAATRWPGARIVAVEPSARNAEFLRRNISQNRIERTTVVQACCTDRNGQALLRIRGESARSTLYSRDNYGSAFEDGESVPAMTLNNLFKEARIETCSLLKMDCEGAEYAILYAAPESVLARIRRISMEYHVGLNENRPEDLALWLRVRGFRVKLSPLIDEESGYLLASR